jgi:hypothetical protein
MEVDVLMLSGGSVRWVGPEIDGEPSVSEIQLDAAALGWPGIRFEEANLRIGSLGSEPLHVEGSVAPAAANLRLHANRVDLKPWSPMMARYSDYSITEGRLSAEIDFKLEGDTYRAPIYLELYGLRATSEGGAFTKTFGMPLAAALPLLSDTADIIRLNVPVSGSLTDGVVVDLVPTVTAVLQQSIENSLVSAAANPIELVGAAARRVGDVFTDAIGEVPFAPGAGHLGAEGRISLDVVMTLNPLALDTRIELVPLVVSDDMVALGFGPKSKNPLDVLVVVGRTLVGGGREAKPEFRERVDEINSERLREVEILLRDKFGIESDRVVVEEWDGRVLEGIPRVELRLSR